MIKLKSDTHQFNCNHFGTLADLKESANSGDQNILIVACCDQGTSPDYISFASPESFFIVQSMAASVPASGESGSDSVLGSIEYAVSMMNVKHAIVCGHLDCKIIPYWLKQRSSVKENCETSSFEKNALRIVDELYPLSTDDERLSLLIREHVLFQLENLISHQFIQTELNDGRLQLHGWLVDDQTATIERYDPNRCQFDAI